MGGRNQKVYKAKPSEPQLPHCCPKCELLYSQCIYEAQRTDRHTVDISSSHSQLLCTGTKQTAIQVAESSRSSFGNGKEYFVSFALSSG